MYKTAILIPPQIAAMDRLPIEKQEQIKVRFGQPLVLSKAYYLLRDATQNFTLPETDTTRRLDEVLYNLIVKKGMLGKTDRAAAADTMPGGNIIIGRPAISGRTMPAAPAVKEPPVRRVSFSDYPLAAKFMPQHQKDLVKRYDDDDKRQILEGIEENLKQLRGYRSQDGMGDNAMVYAHYFYGQTDYFITETDFDQDAGYENLFGFAILNGDTQFAELGAVSLDELVQSRRIELDFYWMPVTLGKAKARAYPDVWGESKNPLKFKVGETVFFDNDRAEEWQGHKVTIKEATVSMPYNEYVIETETGELIEATEMDLKKEYTGTLDMGEVSPPKKNLVSIAKMAKTMAEARVAAKQPQPPKFAPGDKVVSLKDGRQAVIGRMVTSGHGDVLNSYSVKTVDGRELYWYEDEMAPLASIDTSGTASAITERLANRAAVPLGTKIKRAKTTLALLKKALPRLEGARLKTAKTEIDLLTRFLKKNR